MPAYRRDDGFDASPGHGVIGARLIGVALCALIVAAASPRSAQQGQAPVLVVETERGVFAVQTFPADAPRTVAHVIELARAGFYNGLRI
ncbi:MAG: hypothetical protein DMF90_16165, partial [Acidobacteria bacterium]